MNNLRKYCDCYFSWGKLAMGHCEGLKSPYLAFYYNMLDTLDSGLKNYSPKTENIERAGFTYMDRGDRVLCFSCKVELLNWNIIDDPFIEHYKHSKCVNT